VCAHEAPSSVGTWTLPWSNISATFCAYACDAVSTSRESTHFGTRGFKVSRVSKISKFSKVPKVSEAATVSKDPKVGEGYYGF